MIDQQIISDKYIVSPIERFDGETIAVDSHNLILNGKYWPSVMGEFHYSRYPNNSWRNELLRMKMCGINIIATYVFWIHHEEIEGKFDWSGDRNLAQFIDTCHELGLKVVVRIGPWCHGECRNGGLPDWLLKNDFETRSDDPGYLKYVGRYFKQIAEQTSGKLWKDGGPIIAAQCENEYSGPAKHMISIKRIACDVGIDVPIYTRTGWPILTTPMPFGEFIPLFGDYPDGFWDRTIEEMPSGYRDTFLFKMTRTSDGMIMQATESARSAANEDYARYPYFACEIGGGMMTSYHRRIVIDPRDIYALSLVKLGSGNNLQGYYMFHGGTNPAGQLSTLQESQATGYWNDLPVKTYDFQAPLGEYGQVRPHYHLLRKLHLFIGEFGDKLSQMPTKLPSTLPPDGSDTHVVRWSVRSNDESGFLFVNNYARYLELPNRKNVQFDVKLSAETLSVPLESFDIPAGASFILPVNLKLAEIELRYATVQPLTCLQDGNTTYAFFGHISEIDVDLLMNIPGTSRITSHQGSLTKIGKYTRIQGILPSLDAAVTIESDSHDRLVIIVLSEDQSNRLWKASVGCKDRVLICESPLIVDENKITVTNSAGENNNKISICPPDIALCHSGAAVLSKVDGVFSQFKVSTPKLDDQILCWHKVSDPGKLRDVVLGGAGVAEAPSDIDFDNAAVYTIEIPPAPISAVECIVSIIYLGDVARLYLNGELLTDNFYNGNPFEIGLARYRLMESGGTLELKILPLASTTQIYMKQDRRPKFNNSPSVEELISVTLHPVVNHVFHAHCAGA